MIHTILHGLYIAAGVVFLFGAAIFVHEFGHFWVARRCGMKVEAFAIGFGPRMFSWVRDGIEYSVRWIPAGGFVKLPQMVTSTALEGEKKSDDVPPAPPVSKMLVAVAGPIMNVIFAFVVATLVYYVGLPVLVNPSFIGYVDPASAEAKLGIEKGDRIIAVDGHPVKSWEDILKETALALTNTLPVTIQHVAADGERGPAHTYMLKTDSDNALGLKIFNLDPLEHLVVKRVQSGQPAATAQFQVDDEVIGFAGIPVSSQQQFVNLIQKRENHPATVSVLRHGKTVLLTVTPVLDSSAKKYRIGLEFSLPKDVYTIEHPSPWTQVKDDVDQLYKTVTALVHSRESGVTPKELSGPVGILGVLAVEWNTDYRLALKFLVLLNINLAILNMLPVPVLDGGHILMAALERVRRRPLGPRLVEYVTTVFAILIISFMLYVTFFDVKERLPLFRGMFNRQTQIEQPDAPPPNAPTPPG
jgi:regulator of sigma E protease